MAYLYRSGSSEPLAAKPVEELVRNPPEVLEILIGLRHWCVRLRGVPHDQPVLPPVGVRVGATWASDPRH